MSAIVPPTPYIAPRATAFLRSSTQQIAIPVTAMVNGTVTIPVTQWWRLTSVFATWTTDATVASRVPAIRMFDPTSTLVLLSASPLTLAASQTGSVLWMPNQSASSNNAVPSNAFGAAAIPDVLWPPSFSFNVTLFGVQAADALTTGGIAFAEVYRESYPGSLAPVTPVVTPILV